MSVAFISRDDPRRVALAAIADRQADTLRRVTDLNFPGGRPQARTAIRDAILDHAGIYLDGHGPALAARLAPDPRLDATIPPAPPAPSGFVVTVTHGADTVLSVDGENALLSRLPPSEQRGLVAALAAAIHIAAAVETPRSVTSEAAEALDGLTAGLNPSDAAAADAAFAAPILARCHALIDAAKALHAL